MITLDQIEKNQRGKIVEIDTDLLPLKLDRNGMFTRERGTSRAISSL